MNIQVTAIKNFIYLAIIKNILTNKALSKNRFNDWEELKIYLTTNFCDKSTANKNLN